MAQNQAIYTSNTLMHSCKSLGFLWSHSLVGFLDSDEKGKRGRKERGGKRDGGREGEEGGVVGEDLIFIEQALQIDSQHSAVISLQS